MTVGAGKGGGDGIVGLQQLVGERNFEQAEEAFPIILRIVAPEFFRHLDLCSIESDLR